MKPISKAYEERQRQAAEREQRATDLPAAVLEPSTGYQRQSDPEMMRQRQQAAMHSVPHGVRVEHVQDVVGHVKNFEVSPSIDAGPRRSRGMALARELQRKWRPKQPGDDWMLKR